MNPTTTTTKKRDVPLRGWSGRFPITDTARAYFLKGIPPGLWRAVAAKCRRDGISRRTVILQLLTEWVAEPAVVDSEVA